MAVNIDLRFTSSKEHCDLPITVQGDDVDPQGKRIAINDYFINMDGEPWYGVCGEFHYSRVNADRWGEELAKMAMNINIVSTYVFWNHHEEHEGHWNFSGNRNLREFVRLCACNHLYVIVRLGPFAHGEARNGGLPDWLYGKPYEVRSLDPGFLAALRDLYNHETEQLRGLYYADGGPIIAALLDNEYMHSAAPWELTTGVSNEWIPGGHDGEAYLQALRTMATQAGICVLFFTSTGRGGSPMPPDVLPFFLGGGDMPIVPGFSTLIVVSIPRRMSISTGITMPMTASEQKNSTLPIRPHRFPTPVVRWEAECFRPITIGSGCL